MLWHVMLNSCDLFAKFHSQNTLEVIKTRKFLPKYSKLCSIAIQARTKQVQQTAYRVLLLMPLLPVALLAYSLCLAPTLPILYDDVFHSKAALGISDTNNCDDSANGCLTLAFPPSFQSRISSVVVWCVLVNSATLSTLFI